MTWRGSFTVIRQSTESIAVVQFRTLDYNKQNNTRSTLRLPAEPAQKKIIFHSRQMQTCPTTYRRDDTPTHPTSENSSVNDWSRGLLLRQNGLSFPTKAVLPDNGRRNDTLPPPPFPKTPRQMAVLAISSYFHFFMFSLIFLEGTYPPSPPRTPMIIFHLGFVKFNFFNGGTVKRPILHQHTKFRKDRSNRCGSQFFSFSWWRPTPSWIFKSSKF